MPNLFGHARLAGNKETRILNDAGTFSDLPFSMIICGANLLVTELLDQDGDDVLSEYIQDAGESIANGLPISVKPEHGHFTSITISGGGASCALIFD